MFPHQCLDWDDLWLDFDPKYRGEWECCTCFKENYETFTKKIRMLDIHLKGATMQKARVSELREKIRTSLKAEGEAKFINIYDFFELVEHIYGYVFCEKDPIESCDPLQQPHLNWVEEDWISAPLFLKKYPVMSKPHLNKLLRTSSLSNKFARKVKKNWIIDEKKIIEFLTNEYNKFSPRQNVVEYRIKEHFSQ